MNLVYIITSTDQKSELRTLFRQLALLWKFELKELVFPDTINIPPQSLLVIGLCTGSDSYQNYVSSLIQDHSGFSIIFSNDDIVFEQKLKDASGVKSIRMHENEKDTYVEKRVSDILLKGIDSPLCLHGFKSCTAGDIVTDNAESLLASHSGSIYLTRFNNCYTISLPIWQFGIVSFPAWFKIIENAIFFRLGDPHLAPGPYVAFRIDDIPITGESFIKQGYDEAVACSEIKEIQKSRQIYDACLEYMLSSSIITRTGDEFISTDTVAPRAFSLLKKLFLQGELNIGAHGHTHLDTKEYISNRRIYAREFLSLNEIQTLDTLKRIKEWLINIFNKDRFGFVAPAWGYGEGVTKPIASSHFVYIADSNQNLQTSSGAELFGSLHDGCLHMYETWRSGMMGINLANDDLFRGYQDVGLPVHLMVHGPFIFDPLNKNIKKISYATIVTGVALSIFFNARALNSLNVPCQYLLLIAQLGFFVLAFLKRKYLGWLLRLVLSHFFPGCSLRQVARVAKETGVTFLFVEDLAKHMKSYSTLSMTSVIPMENGLTLKFALDESFDNPVCVYLPFEANLAILEPEQVELLVNGNVVFLPFLRPGEYKIRVFS